MYNQMISQVWDLFISLLPNFNWGAVKVRDKYIFLIFSGFDLTTYPWYDKN